MHGDGVAVAAAVTDERRRNIIISIINDVTREALGSAVAVTA